MITMEMVRSGWAWHLSWLRANKAYFIWRMTGSDKWRLIPGIWTWAIGWMTEVVAEIGEGR